MGRNGRVRERRRTGTHGGGGDVAGASTPTSPLPARRVPTRTCVACRTSRAKRDLRRIVRTSTGDVAFDPSGRLAGRGAYVCHDTDCLSIAITKGALTRALETQLPAAFLEEARAGATTTHTIEGGARGKE
ncbi:MAG: RNase P modulator RnpM [Chloroflexota bacterium]